MLDQCETAYIQPVYKGRGNVVDVNSCTGIALLAAVGRVGTGVLTE
jgi:hypothetical protein